MRNKSRLTLANLGDQLGKNSVTVSDYERGKSIPPVEVVIQLAEIFKISIDDIIRKDLQKESYSLVNNKTDNSADIESLKKEIKEKEKLMQQMSDRFERQLKMMEAEIIQRDPDLARRWGLI